MLKTMRKNVKSLAPTLWIVIATFIIAIFAVWGGAGRLGEKARSETVASVGGEKITMNAYYNVLRQRLESMQKEFKQLNRTFIQQLNIPQQVLEQMVQQYLLRRKASELGISASDKEVNDRVVAMFQRDGKFIGVDEYRRLLAFNRLSVGEFEDNLKTEIAINKLIQFLTAGIAVTPEELWSEYQKKTDSAKLEYVMLQESKAAFDQPLTTAELQAYFEKNKAKYALPERREGTYLLLKTDDLKKDVQVTDADVEKYYKDNTDQFKEPERIRVSRIFLSTAKKGTAGGPEQAQNILDRLAKGEDFALLARTHSQDDKAKDGGDWGFDAWNQLSASEAAAVRKLAVGAVSGRIDLPDGVAILKVTEKEPEKTQALDTVKPRIRSVLEDQKARDLAAERIGRLEKAARREKSLDIAAQKEGYKVKTTGALKPGQALEEIDPAGSFSQALFGLKDREISGAIPMFTGTGIVQLDKIDPPRPAAFEEVKADVERDLRTAKRKEITLAKIREALPKLDAKSWEEAATKLGLEYKQINDHKKEQYLAVIGDSPEIDRLAFSLPLNQASEPVEFAGGYAVVRVLERKEANRAEFEKNIDTERDSVLEQKKNRFLQAYLEKLRNEMSVKVNYQLFTQVNNDILSRFEGKE
jgi:peptidyl-prolyl cis-trans isomerase D